MKLTTEEQKMIAGKMGPGTAFAMNLIAKLGEAMGAERMIRPASSHIVSMGFQYYGPLADWNKDFDNEMLEGVRAFKIPVTTNAKFFDPWDKKLAEKFGVNDDVVEKMRQSMSNKRFEKLGAIPSYTCTPFFVNQTRMGESLAGAESVAVVLYNSVYGARVNRETAPTALASAITGRTPDFGMHKPENRYAQVAIALDDALNPEEFTGADYSALGFLAGRIAGDRNVVFTGLPQDMSVGKLKTLLAPLGVSGAVMLAHIVGVTPEAPSLDAALHGKAPVERVNVGRKQLHEIQEMLTTSTESNADVAVFGCPHAPLEEIIEIAKLVDGKKIRNDAILLVATAKPIKVLADRMGLTGVIEKSGGLIVTDMCPYPFLYPTFATETGVKQRISTIATDCTKCAYYAGTQLKVKYGNVAECVNAVM